ncbi:MAG: PH domain-containing protein, partial [Chloroflexota bacterium]
VFHVKGINTGAIGITSKRVIFADSATWKDLTAFTSVPYSRIYSVGCKAEVKVFGSKCELTLKTGGGEFEVEFRGPDKARKAHDLIVAHLL